ncbi:MULTISPECIES: hypothetical protein [unclassified Bradyrhizobium]|uniref:hypothetical protein n=1 Tax=unclassified Bradyrhizobium TaxID=2631580 RepID=UPI0020A04FBE|nr:MULTISPECIES: hypothetical protein [unclassified Bradyrhizobium]MCP1838766.1 hypothetical protein [Bradyrhizobium sp. USDA 4538]MCP1899332.1 hypothetical protein [Bradyrhizobium sp. USDA 4537]MCP1986556.1 hypothetical protein [Bradyrhizobium sp. USDA 4539]
MLSREVPGVAVSSTSGQSSGLLELAGISGVLDRGHADPARIEVEPDRPRNQAGCRPPTLGMFGQIFRIEGDVQLLIVNVQKVRLIFLATAGSAACRSTSPALPIISGSCTVKLRRTIGLP